MDVLYGIQLVALVVVDIVTVPGERAAMRLTQREKPTHETSTRRPRDWELLSLLFAIGTLVLEDAGDGVYGLLSLAEKTRRWSQSVFFQCHSFIKQKKILNVISQYLSFIHRFRYIDAKDRKRKCRQYYVGFAYLFFLKSDYDVVLD